MAGPLDYLKQAAGWANTPLVPPSATAGIDASLTEPHLDQSPNMARLKGFGAGALEGLRGLTTPLNMAGLAAGGFSGPAAAAGEVAGPAMELMDAAPAIGQTTPTWAEAGDMAAQLKQRLGQIPSAGARPALPQVAGAIDPTMTAVGDEALYNSARPIQRPVSAPVPERPLAFRGRLGVQ